MTAVIRFADASRAAWIIISSSIRLRSTGSLPVWTTKMSAPRIDSTYRQYDSPFANVSSSTSPSSTCSCSAIRPASSGCDRPENTISRFCGVSAIAWPTFNSARGGATSRPGSACSIVPLSTASFRDRLAGRETDERVLGDVVRDDRSRSSPRIVADSDRSNEHSVHCYTDVAADRRLALRQSGLMREVRGDRSCADVRTLPDLGVADVRQVRHFRVFPHKGLLQLDERPGLRSRREHRSRPKVTEGANRC